MDVQSPNTDNGARVDQYTYNGNAWQQWQFQDAGSGYWRIISRNSGKCLDVVSASTADGAELVQYTCGTGTNQQFQMVANGGYFQLRARHSGKCVDVPSASTADGVILKQYPCIPAQTSSGHARPSSGRSPRDPRTRVRTLTSPGAGLLPVPERRRTRSPPPCRRSARAASTYAGTARARPSRDRTRQTTRQRRPTAPRSRAAASA